MSKPAPETVRRRVLACVVWALVIFPAVASATQTLSRPFTANLNVANGALSSTVNPVSSGLLVGKRTYQPEPGGSETADDSNYKAWISIPFTSDTFVKDTLGIPFLRTVSSVMLSLRTHPDLDTVNTVPLPTTGLITFNVYGLKNHAHNLNLATDTWTSIAGNTVSSVINVNAGATTLLGSVTLDAATLQAGRTVTLTSRALTEFVNTALDYYFYTHRDHNTTPSGIILILTPATATTPALLFERQPTLSYALRYFNGQVGSGGENTASDPACNRPPIHGGSPDFVAWATGVAELKRGYIQITDTTISYTNAGVSSNRASFGRAEDALGPASSANPDNPYEVVSLGDGGSITLTFAKPITNGPGWDFAVFENGFIDYTNFGFGQYMAWIELAHVEVSSDGVHFVRFPSISLTRPYNSGNYSGGTGFATTDASTVHNLAGKYILGYGTPFDLDDVKDLDPRVDVSRITHVRVIDVVGLNRNSVVSRKFKEYDSVTGAPRFTETLAKDDAAAQLFINHDSEGNEIVDPWPTPFWQGGFDLDAIGVRHQLDPVITWQTWRAATFTETELEDPSISGPHAAPSGNGVSNFLEYALSTSPARADKVILPTAGQTQDGRLTLTFTRSREDVRYIVQGSGDLHAWVAVATNPGTLGMPVTVIDTSPVGTSPRFLRLLIETFSPAP